MTNTNITTSNGFNLTIEDLKKAIRITNVNWAEAAYANPKASSSDPIDICIFDFFNKDAWETVDKDFANDYFPDEDDYDEEFSNDCKILALTRIIKKRSGVWQDWAEQIRIHEEDLHFLTGKPFSFAYAKLFIETVDFGPVLSAEDMMQDYTIIFNKKEKRKEYSFEFVSGEVKYLVTRFYSDERIRLGDTIHNPDFFAIKVEKAND